MTNKSMALFSEKRERNKEAKVMDEMGIPVEVVLRRIVPLLTMKEVARSSVVSKSWLRYWRNTSILSLEDPSGLHNIVLNSLKDSSTYSKALSASRKSFIIWVNNILTNHMGCTLDQFKLVYYLNNKHQVNIDRWLVWAFSKHVQRLVLDFTTPPVSYGCYDEHKHYYVLDRTLIQSCSNTTNLYLTTLCLKSVNFDTSTLNYLLHACASTLDNLCIEKSHYLTTITAASLPSLKSFMVVDCPKLEIIDIHAPNLVSLTFNSGWNTILSVFNIANASKLSYANITVRVEERFLFVLRSLSKYFSHLDHLKLQWHANPNMNLVLDKFPVLANLKHLEILVLLSRRRTLVAWVPFIGACPCLEKLTLEIHGWLLPVPPNNVYQDKCPLRCLKTFEIKSFDGNNLDVDIANFVVHNGINLQKVILHPCNLRRPLNMQAPFARLDFQLPSHVKLVIVE